MPDRPPAHDPRLGHAYAASIFLSAFLLFLVQPMVARMLLPRFGGSPAVWSTALVFFQVALLLGYAYAHWSAVRLTPRRQALVHGALVGLAVVVLPPRIPEALVLRPEAWPVPALLASLALVVGIPFLVLATNSSLVQHWFARRPSTSRSDPYALYAASNAGSLLALLAYPFLVEPLFGVRSQVWLWSAGYVAFAALTGVLMWRAATDGRAPESAAHPPDVAWHGLWRPRAAIDDAAGRRLIWVLRSAVASSLLVATSMAITTDLAAVPLFWVIPLALYLATFIAAFGATRRVPRRLVAGATVVGVATSLVALAVPIAELWAVLLPPLFTLLAGALLCHGDLAAERPPPRHLTAFYLWIALGGALGGAFGSLVAPLAFDSVLEYPLTLVALAWLVSLSPGARLAWPRQRPAVPVTALVPALAMAGFAALIAYKLAYGPGSSRANWLLTTLLLLVYGAAMAKKPGRFGLATTLFVMVYTTGFAESLHVVAQDRSFFGVLRIRETSRERVMLHGTTMHGTQQLDPAGSRIPSGYYHPDGPLWHPVAGAKDGARIAVIGLGTGALAGLADAGQQLTFFEIDPLVERMARAHFTYLADSPADVRVVIGDGRLTLAAQPDGALDVLIVDAFSSDAVPVHLLTAEAMDLYRRKVSADGLVVLHISNRHLDLARVARGYGRLRGVPVAHIQWRPSPAAAREGASRTHAVALAPTSGVIDALVDEPGWSLLGAGPAALWTDDKASVFGVLMW